MPRTRCARLPVAGDRSGFSCPVRSGGDGGFPAGALKGSRSRQLRGSGCSRFARVQVDVRRPTSFRKPRRPVMYTGSSVAERMLKHTRIRHDSDTPVPRSLHHPGRLHAFRAGGTPGTSGGPDDAARAASRSHLSRAFREHASTVAVLPRAMQPTLTHHDRAQSVQTAGGPGQCRGTEFGPETLTSPPRQVRRGYSMLASRRGGGTGRGPAGRIALPASGGRRFRYIGRHGYPHRGGLRPVRRERGL